MNFADCLRCVDPKPGAPARLRKSLAKAGLGLLGLATLPLLAGGGAALGPALKMALALGAACGLAFLALRLLSRRGRSGAAAEDLKLVARTALSQKSGVALLQADGRRYLVAFGDGFATLLSITPAVVEPDGELR